MPIRYRYFLPILPGMPASDCDPLIEVARVVPAVIEGPFIANDAFTNSGRYPAVSFHHLKEQFRRLFLTRTEAPRESRELRCLEMNAANGITHLYDGDAYNRYGGTRNAEVGLAEVFGLLLRQPYGEVGPLLTAENTRNIFYVDEGAEWGAMNITAQWNIHHLGWMVHSWFLEYEWRTK